MVFSYQRVGIYFRLCGQLIFSRTSTVYIKPSCMVLMKDREDERLFLRTKLFSSIRRRDEGVSAEQNGS